MLLGALFLVVFFSAFLADAIASPVVERKRTLSLDCITEANEEYAGVPFRYTIDEVAESIHVSRWGEPKDVVFGPAFITYRTRGMALKMTVSVNRETWQFTMLHDGGVFVVTGSCKEVSGR